MNFVDLKRTLRKNVLVNGCVKHYYASKHKKNVMRLHKYGYRINEEVGAVLDGKIEYCAYAGTLLGVVRDNDFVKGDDDLDYCVNIRSKADWNLLYECMKNAGYSFKHYFVYKDTITEMAFLKRGLGVDFFGLQPYEERTSTIAFYRDPREKYNTYEASCMRVVLNPYSMILERYVNGTKFLIPDNYEEVLISNYGNSWRIPQKVSYTDILGERIFMPKEHGEIHHRWSK